MHKILLIISLVLNTITIIILALLLKEQMKEEYKGKIYRAWVGLPMKSYTPMKNTTMLVQDQHADKLLKEFDHITNYELNIRKIYYEFPHNIMRADLIRWIIIYLLGETYLDHSIYNIFDIEEKFQDIILFIEHIQNEKTNNETQFLPLRKIAHQMGLIPNLKEDKVRVMTSAFIAKTKKHWFILEVIKEIARRWNLLGKTNLQHKKDYFVLFITGPDVITSLYHKWKHHSDITLLPRKHVKRGGPRTGWRDKL
jgi:hypothetical protein